MNQCDSSGDEYEELEDEMLDIECLFCDFRQHSHNLIFDHIKQKHNVKLIELCKSFKLDTFQYIKLVNYIRRNKIDALKLGDILESSDYDCDEYFKPTLENDHLLMFDFEEDDNQRLDNEENIKTLDKNDYENRFKELSETNLKLKNELETAKKCIDEMQNLIRISIEDDCQDANNAYKPKVASLNEQTDKSYISSYSHFSIHHVMLSDKPRMYAYRDAIYENASYFKGKTVLDIGCGTGILSLFAAKCDAKLVVAIDQSDVIYNSMDIIIDNGLDGVIKTVKGKLETTDFASLDLPTKYDIIISEWMGYFLLFEGMLDTVIYARDNLMEKEGKLLPNRSKMFLAAFSDSNFYEKNIDFWNDVCGFRMTSMIKDVTKEVTVDTVGAHNICSSTQMIAEIDICKCSIESVQQISSKINLQFKKDSTIHGLVGWFDCYFDSLTKSVVLSTSPFSEETHWKHAIFPLQEPISIKAGQSINGDIKIMRSDFRGLKVDIFLESQNMLLQYIID